MCHALLVKIDQEMRPWECGQTYRQTHAVTETNRIAIICPMLYTIAMRQIK